MGDALVTAPVPGGELNSRKSARDFSELSDTTDVVGWSRLDSEELGFPSHVARAPARDSTTGSAPRDGPQPATRQPREDLTETRHRLTPVSSPDRQGFRSGAKVLRSIASVGCLFLNGRACVGVG